MTELIQKLLDSELGYLGLLGMTFAGVVALMLAVRYALASRVDSLQERIRRTVNVDQGSVPPGAAFDSTPPRAPGFMERGLRGVTSLARPTDDEELGRLQAQLQNAGYRSERAMFVYLTFKLVGCLGFAGLLHWVNSLRAVPFEQVPLLTIISMIIGYYLPNVWLSSRADERRTTIDRTLPDAVDLLVTCVEAGQGLDQAMNRVADEIVLSSPILSAELNQCALEIRAGVSRGEAFRRLATRTGVEDLKNLASIVVQTELFGTSVAKSLRVMSDSMRIRRMQRAEEKAAMVAVKMTVPLILFILPSLFIVLAGPATVRIVRLLLPGLGGG